MKHGTLRGPVLRLMTARPRPVPRSPRLAHPGLLRRAVSALAPATALLFAACARPPAPPPPPPPAPAPAEIPDPDPDAGFFPVLLPLPPDDLETIAADESPARSSDHAALYAWRCFVSLHWPTQADGQRDPHTLPGLSGDNPTVWSTWSASAPTPLLDSTDPAVHPRRTLSLDTLAGDLFPDLPTPLDRLPLIDQNGRRVAFECRTSDPTLSLPPPGPAQRALLSSGQGELCAAAPGSLHLLAIWKILPPSEHASGRFHSSHAFIATPLPREPGAAPLLTETVVGLVGLHFTTKTATGRHRVWASFEHVDNRPLAGQAPYRAAYNFYDKRRPVAAEKDPFTLALTDSLDTTRGIVPPEFRPQFVRHTPPDDTLRALNAAHHAAYRAINPASVWQYYELVSAGAAPCPPPPHDSPAGPPVSPAPEDESTRRGPPARRHSS